MERMQRVQQQPCLPIPSLPSLTLRPNIGRNVWKMALVGQERRWFDQQFNVASDGFGKVIARGDGAGTAFCGKRVAGDRNAVQTTGVFGRRVFQGLQWNVGRDWHDMGVRRMQPSSTKSSTKSSTSPRLRCFGRLGCLLFERAQPTVPATDLQCTVPVAVAGVSKHLRKHKTAFADKIVGVVRVVDPALTGVFDDQSLDRFGHVVFRQPSLDHVGNIEFKVFFRWQQQSNDLQKRTKQQTMSNNRGMCHVYSNHHLRRSRYLLNSNF